METRSAVDEILAFNKHFPPEQLDGKLAKLSESPFTFFRATFHLFARDLTRWHHDWPLSDITGAIIGDLHTENFGSFRAVTDDIVYDINDFDEATKGCYEVDLRRLTTSILLGALDNKHSFGDGVRAAELTAQAYFEALAKLSDIRDRKKLERLSQTTEILSLFQKTAAKSRAEFMEKLAVETAPGRFAFKHTERILPVNGKTVEEVKQAIPNFLAHVLAPAKARPTEYTFQDVAFRFAGAGSLGRARYALLFGKGIKKQEDWATLRLIEWKESLDSALDASEPRASKDRAQQVFAFTRGFQLFPKRYLGFTTMNESPMQTKEIGANDARFDPKSMQDPQHFQRAADMFGRITARAHLLGSIGEPGPRLFKQKLKQSENRFIHKLLSFAVAYADRTFEDFDELIRRKAEIAQAWKLNKSTGLHGASGK